MISSYKNIIWDFDGVLIDSSEIRIFAFKEILKDYSVDKVNKLINFHKKNDGLSRYVKIDYFFSDIINQSIDNKKRTSLLKEFGKIYGYFQKRIILTIRNLTYLRKKNLCR